MTDPKDNDQSYSLQGVSLNMEDNGPENDGVNLQCVNSSDFVIGKQTTFNGPVTIINCATETKDEVDAKFSPSKEEIVIREKIITPSAMTEMKTFADKKSDDKPVESHKKMSNIKESMVTKKFMNIPIIVWILLVAVTIAGCLAYFLTDVSDSKYQTDESRVRSIHYNGVDYKYLTKKGWNARPPHSVIPMKSPVPYVVISHTATRFCYLERECRQLVRDIQGDHMSRTPPLADIAYSFLVGGDGVIYEGRGWTAKTASVSFVNGKSININFIGSFENLDSPTYPQTEAVKALIEYGLNNTYIDQDYSLIAANATYSTLSPGIQVYKIIKTWPHFDANPLKNLHD